MIFPIAIVLLIIVVVIVIVIVIVPILLAAGSPEQHEIYIADYHPNIREARGKPRSESYC